AQHKRLPAFLYAARSIPTLGRRPKNSRHSQRTCSPARIAGWSAGPVSVRGTYVSGLTHRRPHPCYVLRVGGPETLGSIEVLPGGDLVWQGRKKPNARSQASFDRNEVEIARGSRARFNRTIAAATGSPDPRACGSRASR